MSRGTWRSQDGTNYYYDPGQYGYYNTGHANFSGNVSVSGVGQEPEPSREQLEQWMEEGKPARLVRNRWLIHLLRVRAKLRSKLRGARKGPEV